MNPILQAYVSSDPLGKSIFIILFLLSIITWAVFLQKYFLYRETRREGASFQAVFQKNNTNPLNLEPQLGHPFALLYRSLKKNTSELLSKNQASCLSAYDIDHIKAHLASARSSQIKSLQKHLFILSTVVSLAPFLGLLGTVWGILLTFGELQIGGVINTNATIMGGLSMALGTTVFGLLVAIPALIAYNYLRASLSTLSTDLDDFSQTMISSVELHYRVVDV